MQHVGHRASDEIAQLRQQNATLRANLRSVTDSLEMLLDAGRFPKAGRSADDWDAAVGWWDDHYAQIAAARAALAQQSE